MMSNNQLVARFNIWWRDEGKERMTYHSEEGEKLVYDLCYTAWMNGAYVGAEV